MLKGGKVHAFTCGFCFAYYFDAAMQYKEIRSQSIKYKSMIPIDLYDHQIARKMNSLAGFDLPEPLGHGHPGPQPAEDGPGPEYRLHLLPGEAAKAELAAV